ncbi:MAG: 50S ribosomal protein L4, partial [Anaerolineales bacterium]
GRARQGSIRAAQWVGGGKIHTPHPRDYTKRMPRKMRRAALRAALSVKAAEAQIVVLDELKIEGPQTRIMAETLRKLVGQDSVLILITGPDESLEKSVRNLPTAKTLRANYLNVRDLLGFDRLILPLGALDVIQSYLGE